MIKVLVLGKNGMLGSMIFDYLTKVTSLNITGTERGEFDVEKFLKNPLKFSRFKNFDYVINCIGIIKPYCKDTDPEGVIKAIRINSLFPHELTKFYRGSLTKIIQIATDCVFSGRSGNYNEDSIHDPVDVYGMTKSLGEVLSGNFLNIRCSIIGPELKNNQGLLAWFLNQQEGSKLKGFVNHRWNGVTTLQFAKLCKQIIEQNNFKQLIKINHVLHFTPNNSVNKNELLSLFSKTFEKKIDIEKFENIEQKDLTLKTDYSILSKLFGKSNIEKALLELKTYIKNSEMFRSHDSKK